MVFEFRSALPIAETMVFEKCYERRLQLTAEDKIPLLANGLATWLFVDGTIAGETYGLTPKVMNIIADEKIEDCDPLDDRNLYCYSTTVLPAYRGHGLAKILKAYLLARATERGYEKVIGHSTVPAMRKINRLFGGHEGLVHKHWYGTDREAVYYEIDLDQSRTVQRTEWDCGIIAFEYLMRCLGKVPLERKAALEAGCTTAHDGTSHSGMKALAAANGHKCREIVGIPASDLPLLAIVNYLWEGDGHYGVLVKKTPDETWIYNPATGKIDSYNLADFDLIFHSPRYALPRWSLICDAITG